MVTGFGRARCGEKNRVQSGPEPLLGLAQAHAALQKSVTRKVEMTGHGLAGILEWPSAMLKLRIDQMIAETGGGEDRDAFIPVLGINKNTTGKSAD